MRDIKCKGKVVGHGGWVTGGFFKHINRTPCPIGDSVQESDIEYIIVTSGFSDWNLPRPVTCYLVDPETVGEFTGYCDKHGKEMYEGDIVQDAAGETYVIEFTDGAFYAVGNVRRLLSEFYSSDGCQFELVGNRSDT